jgi:hypothetical protein
MSDNYQAVYGAVRSKMSYFDASELLARISSNFDISYAVENIKTEFVIAAQATYDPVFYTNPKCL